MDVSTHTHTHTYTHTLSTGKLQHWLWSEGNGSKEILFSWFQGFGYSLGFNNFNTFHATAFWIMTSGPNSYWKLDKTRMTDLDIDVLWPWTPHFLITYLQDSDKRNVSLSNVFPHVWIPPRWFLLGGGTDFQLQRGSFLATCQTPLFACWAGDRNHGYDLGEGKPLHSRGCEVPTSVWLLHWNKEARAAKTNK